jgi:hypothetical protein
MRRPAAPHVGETAPPPEPPPFEESGVLGPVPGAIYGLMAEFESGRALAHATRAVREAGYEKVDAYTPFPVHEVVEALGFRRTWIPLIVLIGGIVGLLAGYYLQYWITVIDYPLNVGGRPLHSWPAFIPATFETTILFAAFGAVFGMLALNGLPMPYHPVFNVPRFSESSRDGFFLVVESDDPQFDYHRTRQLLQDQNPREVFDVPH